MPDETNDAVATAPLVPRTNDGQSPRWWHDPDHVIVDQLNGQRMDNWQGRKRITNVPGVTWDRENELEPFWQVWAYVDGKRVRRGRFKHSFDAACRARAELEVDDVPLEWGSVVVRDDGIVCIDRCLNDCKGGSKTTPKPIMEYAPYPSKHGKNKLKHFLQLCDWLESGNPSLVHRARKFLVKKNARSPACHDCRSKNKKSWWYRLDVPQKEEYDLLRQREVRIKTPIEEAPADCE